MHSVDYDRVASTYDRRNDRTRYEGIQAGLHGFIASEPRLTAVVEVGCGTGHSDADYEAGMRRLRADRPVLRSDVTLYATTAWLDDCD